MVSLGISLNYASEKIQSEAISFKSGNNTLKGVIFTPNEKKEKYPAITIIGPVGYVKEQAPLNYAKELVKEGYKVVIFDATYHGESEGKPRRFESGKQKTKDIQASITYLETLKDVEKSSIYGVGVCQGANWMTKALNEDKRLKSIAVIAGHYLVPKVSQLYTGGKEKLSNRLEKAKKAKMMFETTGEVEYIPVVSLENKDALLLHKSIHDWYMPWVNKSTWENKITRMSELGIWGIDMRPEMKSVSKPILMVHSNKAASGKNVPKELFKSIQSKDKKLVWFENQVQFDFYEDEKTIKRVTKEINNWFKEDI